MKKEAYKKGGKVKVYAVLYHANMGVIADMEVSSEDPVAAMRKFRELGIDIPEGSSVRFTSHQPFYYGRGGGVSHRRSHSFKHAPAVGGAWVVYDCDTDKLISTHKSHLAALRANNKLWDTGEHNCLGMKLKDDWEREHPIPMGGGGSIEESDLDFTDVIKSGDVEVWNFKDFLGTDADIEESPTDFTVDFSVDLDIKSYGIRDISITVNRVYGSIEWSADTFILTAEQKAHLLSIGGKEYKSRGTIDGIVNVDSMDSGVKSKSKWDISSEVECNGQATVGGVEIDFRKNTMIVT
jgi:hypothetical protein